MPAGHQEAHVTDVLASELPVDLFDQIAFEKSEFMHPGRSFDLDMQSAVAAGNGPGVARHARPHDLGPFPHGLPPPHILFEPEIAQYTRQNAGD
jgi:hypothetical protein